eukprot:TRINITY_DN13340_c1_g2_i2.p1 TRINITY_DN13340_c1_g2~~TRINITY_DN13340_c1_g2_i2.p1  ORF type:complete len:277 (-),score=49.27 TRINITY_DN13340_c1_g2_i2:70-825(-)
MVATTQAWKFREVPFPFPHAQMLTALLLVTTFLMPFISLEVSNKFIAPFLTFLAVAAMWSVNYTAQELEEPFGDDIDDFPVWRMQDNFNRSLKVLISPMCLAPPLFNGDIAKTIQVSCEEMDAQEGLSTMGLVKSDVDPLKGSVECKTIPQLLGKQDTRGLLKDAVKGPRQSQGVTPSPVECPPQIQGLQKESALGESESQALQKASRWSQRDLKEDLQPPSKDDAADSPLQTNRPTRRSSLGTTPAIGTE